jgi:hypothetical protein
MAITAAYERSAQSVGASEYSIPGNTTTGVPTAQTTAGVYQCFVDLSSMAKGDEFEFKCYEKAVSGGTARLVFSQTFLGDHATLFVTPTIILLNGWDMTMKKLVGTDRTFDMSIRKVA